MCWLQWISYGMSDVPSLFSRHIFPMWRCSQTAATNGSVNLHSARQSPKYMRAATSQGKRGDGGFLLYFILMHLLMFCECDTWSYFCSCTQLITGDKQSFIRPIWITFANMKWILVLQTLSDFIQACTKAAKARRQSSCSGALKGFPEMLSRSSLSIQTPQWLPEHWEQSCCWLIT